MKEEQWFSVASVMNDTGKIILGEYGSHCFYKNPRQLLYSLSYYKFAAKMIGKNKKTLDVGCNEGLGTYLLAKECGFTKGIDFDEKAIDIAQKNFSSVFLQFSKNDFLKYSTDEKWDAIVSFDVIEHIYPENSDLFFKVAINHMDPHGIFIIGTLNEISLKYTSEVSKKEHVNIYSHDRLEQQMRKFFEFVFLFSASDEMVHTDYLPLAHNFIAVGCKPKVII
jgi:2-polyprenyl-3-methyl-5-hydroxy-6-metoxy-1,4-benzoquinol methylase